MRGRAPPAGKRLRRSRRRTTAPVSSFSRSGRPSGSRGNSTSRSIPRLFRHRWRSRHTTIRAAVVGFLRGCGWSFSSSCCRSLVDEGGEEGDVGAGFRSSFLLGDLRAEARGGAVVAAVGGGGG